MAAARIAGQSFCPLSPSISWMVSCILAADSSQYGTQAKVPFDVSRTSVLITNLVYVFLRVSIREVFAQFEDLHEESGVVNFVRLL